MRRDAASGQTTSALGAGTFALTLLLLGASVLLGFAGGIKWIGPEHYQVWLLVVWAVAWGQSWWYCRNVSLAAMDTLVHAVVWFVAHAVGVSLLLLGG